MQFLKQSTSAAVKLGPFVDQTDGFTAETGLAISQADIRLSKNGADFAQTSNASGATHDEAGYYDATLSSTDTNTLGRLIVAVHESGARPVRQEYMVLPANVYDSLIADSDYLDTNTVQISGSTPPTSTFREYYVDVNVSGGDSDGRDKENSFASITSALAAVDSDLGAVLVIAAGTYAENVTISKSGVTLVGVTGTSIAPASGNAITVSADSVTLLRLETTAAGTGLVVGAVDGFRARNCTFDSVNTSAALDTPDLLYCKVGDTYNQDLAGHTADRVWDEVINSGHAVANSASVILQAIESGGSEFAAGSIVVADVGVAAKHNLSFHRREVVLQPILLVNSDEEAMDLTNATAVRAQVRTADDEDELVLDLGAVIASPATSGIINLEFDVAETLASEYYKWDLFVDFDNDTSRKFAYGRFEIKESMTREA
jgi:hypothetical protein